MGLTTKFLYSSVLLLDVPAYLLTLIIILLCVVVSTHLLLRLYSTLSPKTIPPGNGLRDGLFGNTIKKKKTQNQAADRAQHWHKHGSPRLQTYWYCVPDSAKNKNSKQSASEVLVQRAFGWASSNCIKEITKK
jgi:hypothetical protein